MFTAALESLRLNVHFPRCPTVTSSTSNQRRFLAYLLAGGIAFTTACFDSPSSEVDTDPPEADVSDADVAATPDAPPEDVGADLGVPDASQADVPGEDSGVDAVPDAEPQDQCETGPATTGESRLRRLTNVEYHLTMQALFQTATPPDIALVPAEATENGFQGVVSRQSLSASHLSAYMGIAGALAEELVADEDRSLAVVGCELQVDGCLESFVLEFGRLAWRRDLAAEEAERIIETATDAADTAEDRFQIAVQVLLTSPNFLFRVEVGADLDGVTVLGAQELAARLSFALWGIGPSADLLDEALTWDLGDDDLLTELAEGMLDDARVEAFYLAFFEQWLGYGYPVVPGSAPENWSAEVAPALAQETEALVAEFAFSPGANIFDLLTANHTYITHPDQAAFYNVEDPAPIGRLEFEPGDARANAGLLTHPALIGAKRDGELIPIRGDWVRSTFLCQDLALPAGLLDDIGEELALLTEEELVEQRNTEPECSGCHRLIDPIGIGMSIFDELGVHDPESDPTRFGMVTQVLGATEPEFTSMAELAQVLRSMPDLSECFVDRLYLFVHGREPTRDDECHIRRMHTAFAAGEYTLRDLLVATVSAPEFRLRRPLESE